ncbi:hypothetical protein F4823DRAFT_601553 [Ustulina deusta]|nr:hypothetical protein F4823DRAFT_601553 [Ustulina deusta]
MRMLLNSGSDLVDPFLEHPPRHRTIVQLDDPIIHLTQCLLLRSCGEKDSLHARHSISSTKRDGCRQLPHGCYNAILVEEKADNATVFFGCPKASGVITTGMTTRTLGGYVS